jgi:hypothetical protein
VASIIAGVGLPTANGGIGVERVDFHSIAAAPNALGGD